MTLNECGNYKVIYLQMHSKSTGKPIIIGVIPARYNSSRFQGKIIADIAGKPMIQWVYERAKQSKILDKIGRAHV